MEPTLRAIRRYPVKAMAGEDLAEVAVSSRGLDGDRWYAVVDDDGRLASGKTTRRFRRRDSIFGYSASTTAEGVVQVSDGSTCRPLGPELDDHLTRSMGTAVRVAPEASTPHHDDSAVSLVGTASLDWCVEHLGVDGDHRRLRPNLLVATEEPFAEETWVGHEVTIGTARLRVTGRAPRCRMIDLAQDGARVAERWLLRLTEARGGYLAVYLDVLSPGAIRAGDAVRVLQP